jgi:hypothetical protein
MIVSPPENVPRLFVSAQLARLGTVDQVRENISDQLIRHFVVVKLVPGGIGQSDDKISQSRIDSTFASHGSSLLQTIARSENDDIKTKALSPLQRSVVSVKWTSVSISAYE